VGRCVESALTRITDAFNNSLIKKLKNPLIKALDALQNNGRLQLSVDNDLMEVENDEIP